MDNNSNSQESSGSEVHSKVYYNPESQSMNKEIDDDEAYFNEEQSDQQVEQITQTEKNHQFPDWEVGPNYLVERVLGTGSYGSVCRAIQLQSGRKVAIKRVKNVFEDDIDCKRILREITLLRKLNHPSVVKIVEILEPTDVNSFQQLYIVMEYMQSDLKKLIRSSLYLETYHIQKIMYNMLAAVKYLHDSRVLHRDLKPANVLINEDCSIKICDFGLARSIWNQIGSYSSDEEIKKEPSGTCFLPKINNGPQQDQQYGIISYQTPQKQKQISKIIKTQRAVSRYGSQNRQAQVQKKQSSAVNTSGGVLANGIEVIKCQSSLGGADYSVKPFASTRERSRQNPRALKLQRLLSQHVVTRWYRAPELILLDKTYGTPIDMWSMGCILAELLSMMKLNVPNYQDRKALFPGQSCYPLSPVRNLNIKSTSGGYPSDDKYDQLGVIIEFLGTPNELDRSFIKDEKALHYLKHYPQKYAKDLRVQFPGAPQDSIDLLRKMLKFNPNSRITIEDCLNHPFITAYSKKEILRSTPDQSNNLHFVCSTLQEGKPIPVSLDFDNEVQEPSRGRLWELIISEINHYKILRNINSKQTQQRRARSVVCR